MAFQSPKPSQPSALLSPRSRLTPVYTGLLLHSYHSSTCIYYHKNACACKLYMRAYSPFSSNSCLWVPISFKADSSMKLLEESVIQCVMYSWTWTLALWHQHAGLSSQTDETRKSLSCLPAASADVQTALWAVSNRLWIVDYIAELTVFGCWVQRCAA